MEWGGVVSNFFFLGGRRGGQGIFKKVFPMHSHEVPQDFPSSTALLSHMFWPKFNFHIYIYTYTLKGARGKHFGTPQRYIDHSTILESV